MTYRQTLKARRAKGKSKVSAKPVHKRPKPAHGVELKPTDYQPSKAELEADARLPATFHRVVDVLFARNKMQSDMP